MIADALKTLAMRLLALVLKKRHRMRSTYKPVGER